MTIETTGISENPTADLLAGKTLTTGRKTALVKPPRKGVSMEQAFSMYLGGKPIYTEHGEGYLLRNRREWRLIRGEWELSGSYMRVQKFWENEWYDSP